jgi:hypothetical protein
MAINKISSRSCSRVRSAGGFVKEEKNNANEKYI